MKASALLLAATLAFASFAPAFAANDYAEVECNTNPAFAANNCNQCFDGGKAAVGQKLTGLYDTWTNKNASEQIAYKDEQKYPEIVNLGGDGTSWKSTPTDETQFWKYGSEVLWVDSLTGTGKQEFVLDPGKSITFMEADLGANYSLAKTDAKGGDPVGLLKFPVVYHDINSSGKESAAQTHYECVLLAADVSAAPAPTPAPTPAPPPKATAVKTGPESFLLVGLAGLLSLSLLAFRRKKA